MEALRTETHWLSLRSTGMWFVAAGILLVIRAVVELAEPVYWNPSSLLDYSAAVLTTAAWVVTGVAFMFWWRTTPIRRGSILLLVAGLATAMEGIGNFIEDVLDMEFGELLFSYGGMIGAISILAAAVLMLTVRNPLRWSALLLLALLAGAIFPDSGGEFASGASLIALGVWLIRYRPTDQSESVSHS